MYRIVCIAFAALLVTCCSASFFNLGSVPRTIEVRDCRRITGKGESADAWFLMSKDATLYLDQKQYNSVKVGREVCGPWKDKEKAAEPKIERKILPDVDCEEPWRIEQRCNKSLKS